MSAIGRAVLLAAGRGSRLGALTEGFPKPMLDVGGTPILHRIIRGLAEAGVTGVAVITGHAAEELERATGDGSAWGVTIRYLRQEKIEGTARAVSLAREFVGESSCFVGWGDIVVDPANYQRIIAAAAAGNACLAVTHVADPSIGAAVYVDAASMVTGLVEKPPPGTSTTNWNNAGLMVLTPEIWPYIDRLEPSARGEWELPQAVAAFIADGGSVRAVPIEGPWFDIGTPASLAAARRHFS